MMITITTVIPVSRFVGQETFAVSARTCRINSPGLVFAINPISILKNNVPATAPPPENPARKETLLSGWAAFRRLCPKTQALRGIFGVSVGRRAALRFGIWQEWRDSNPRPSVLETDALPTELHSYGQAARIAKRHRRRKRLGGKLCHRLARILAGWGRVPP